MAHTLVRDTTAAILSGGGSLACFATSEPRIDDSDSNTSLVFDWTVIAAIDDHFSRHGTNNSARPVIVTSQKAIHRKIPEHRRTLFNRVQHHSDLLILEDEEYTGGTIRDSIIARTDALVLVSGGKGVTDLYHKMRRKGGPVFPIHLQLGSTFHDGVGAEGLTQKALTAPSDFFTHTHERFRRLLVGLQSDPTSSLALAPSEVVSLIAEELSPVGGEFSQLAAPADIVIATVLPEEYEATSRILGNPPLLPGTAGAPNVYAWRLASVHSGRYRSPFRIVLVLCGEPCSCPLSSVVSRAIDVWTPRYVLLVGIAGGLSGALSHGDVVVSTDIAAYEYGKINKTFLPRMDFTYRCDRGLLRAAEVASTKQWLALIDISPPRPTTPKAVFGIVASGDKVIDTLNHPSFKPVLEAWGGRLAAIEMEGAGVANVIENRQAEGFNIGFLMVRGVSDLPAPTVPWGLRIRRVLRRLIATRRTHTDALSGGTLVRDSWKEYAAVSAASFAVNLVYEAWPVAPRCQPEQ